MEWTGYKKGQVYKASQLADALKEAFEEQQADIVEDNRVFYYNCPASFDIETSSFYNEDGEKRACMYIWQMGFNGTVIYGRTWEEWLNCLEQLVDYLELDETHRLIIYVHNLGYEFQFIRKFFDWDKVFAIKQRRPVYALCKGLEFRCSLFLSNYALAYIGDNLLHKYPVKKLVGDLDYSKLRHSKTPLTEQELAYCINDVKVVMSYIQEKIEQDGDITKIPLTNTGYVRNYCRKECFFEGIPEEDEEGRKRVLMNYRAIMKSLQIESKVEYEPVKDGKFSLPNGKLSFAMPEGWKLASMAIAYQFADEDEYNDNKFNLVVSKTDSPIEEVTSEQMTATYSATMENFKLVAFEHTEIAGKSAVYMQLTGMVSQVTRQTTITQYMIQSGEDAYCFSFTQSTDDGVFPDLIAGVIDSLEIQ